MAAWSEDPGEGVFYGPVPYVSLIQRLPQHTDHQEGLVGTNVMLTGTMSSTGYGNPIGVDFMIYKQRRDILTRAIVLTTQRRRFAYSSGNVASSSLSTVASGSPV